MTTATPATATTRRPTIAHLKKFIAKYRDNGLLVRQTSKFDGMTDGVESCPNAAFHPATKATYSCENNFGGIAGVYCVFQSRDRISEINEIGTGMIGYEVYNCCGSFSVAVRVAQETDGMDMD